MGNKIIPTTQLYIENIFCIGRNYALHAKELNNPIPEAPVVFLKPTSSVVYSGESFVIPNFSSRADHEVEVVVVVGKSGKNIEVSKACEYISHIGIGIDFTARDTQSLAKSQGLPWSIAKGADTFCGLGSFQPFDSKAIDLKNLNFSLSVNGERRQEGNTRDMLFPIESLVAYLSTIFTLSPGDLIFTGTPEGVGPLNEGDLVSAKLEKLSTLSLSVKKA